MGPEHKPSSLRGRLAALARHRGTATTMNGAFNDAITYTMDAKDNPAAEKKAVFHWRVLFEQSGDPKTGLVAIDQSTQYLNDVWAIDSGSSTSAKKRLVIKRRGKDRKGEEVLPLDDPETHFAKLEARLDMPNRAKGWAAGVYYMEERVPGIDVIHALPRLTPEQKEALLQGALSDLETCIASDQITTTTNYDPSCIDDIKQHISVPGQDRKHSYIADLLRKHDQVPRVDLWGQNILLQDVTLDNLAKMSSEELAESRRHIDFEKVMQAWPYGQDYIMLVDTLHGVEEPEVCLMPLFENRYRKDGEKLYVANTALRHARAWLTHTNRPVFNQTKTDQELAYHAKRYEEMMGRIRAN